MGTKWCPAGKIECGCYWAGISDLGFCTQKNIHTECIHNFEQCPWPSRQQKPETETENKEK